MQGLTVDLPLSVSRRRRLKLSAGERAVSDALVDWRTRWKLGEACAMQSLKHSAKSPSASDLSVTCPEHFAVRFLDRRLVDDEEPIPGTHIISPRCGYLHHGIYVGEGRVVHYAGLAYGFHHGPVEEVSLEKFTRGRGVWARWRPPAFDRAEIIRRARSRVGEAQYRILDNNCEHFCEWCVHGESRSYQVERLLSSRRPLAIMVLLIARWEARDARRHSPRYSQPPPSARNMAI